MLVAGCVGSGGAGDHVYWFNWDIYDLQSDNEDGWDNYQVQFDWRWFPETGPGLLHFIGRRGARAGTSQDETKYWPELQRQLKTETVTVFVVLIETPTIWFMAGCLGPGLSPPIMRVVRWWPVQFSLSNEMLRCWLLFLHLLTHWHSLAAPPVPPAIICKLSTQLNLINIKFM